MTDYRTALAHPHPTQTTVRAGVTGAELADDGGDAPVGLRDDHVTIARARAARLRNAAALLALTMMLTGAALYNRYPIVFSDTAAYVWGVRGGIPPDKPYGYIAFLKLAGLDRWLWPSVIAQSFITALALRIVLWTYPGARRARVLMGIGVVLCTVTIVPWFTGQVMPDFLAAVAVLSGFLLLVRWNTASPAARVAANALLVVACAAHYSEVILVSVLAGLWLTWGVMRRDLARVRGGARLAASVAAACLLVIAMNLANSGGKKIYLTRGGHVFMVGRLLESHVLQRLLADRCGQTPYLLCPYRAQLPDSLELFMFAPGSPIEHVGGLAGMPEAPSTRMIRDAVRYYPRAVIGSSLRNGAHQFVTFYTGDGLHPYREGDPRFWRPPAAIRDVYPAEYAPFMASREQRNLIPIRFLRLLHGVVAWLSLAGSVLVIVGAIRARRRATAPARRPAPPAADLHAFVWLAATLNALICASLTTVTDRLQSRIVWLFAFACLLTVALRAAERRSSQPGA